MSEIKRYILEPRPVWVPTESGNGDWVRCEDYERTRKELEELQDAIKNFIYLEWSESDRLIINNAIQASRERTNE